MFVKKAAKNRFFICRATMSVVGEGIQKKKRGKSQNHLKH